MSATIAIISHECDGFQDRSFCLNEIAQIWRQSGLVVSVLTTESASLIEADLAILHVDLTVVPPEYLAMANKFPVVLNGRVNDVSKSVISSNIVSRGNGYQGPVVVKTNRNYGGNPEARLVQLTAKGADPTNAQQSAIGFRSGQSSVHISRWRHWSLDGRLDPYAYPVFDSVDQVPPAVWSNQHLIVERFLPERREGYYCLRTWFFLGDRETNSLSYSNEPIIKSGNVVRREKVAEVPEELRQMRRDLGFDFGKFDYAIVDGLPVLYDANPTPSLGRLSKEQFLPNLRLLAEGVRTYL